MLLVACGRLSCLSVCAFVEVQQVRSGVSAKCSLLCSLSCPFAVSNVGNIRAVVLSTDGQASLLTHKGHAC